MRRIAEGFGFIVALPFFLAAQVWYATRRSNWFDD